MNRRPLTPAELARCRKSLDIILNDTESPTAQMHGAAFWASLWGERLLITAEPRFITPWDSSHGATPGATTGKGCPPPDSAPGNHSERR